MVLFLCILQINYTRILMEVFVMCVHMHRQFVSLQRNANFFLKEEIKQIFKVKQTKARDGFAAGNPQSKDSSAAGAA